MGNTVALIAVVALVAGPLLAHFEVVPALIGFGVFALGGLVALLAALWGLVGLVRGRRLGTGRVLALLAALVFVAIAVRGAGHPRINDFTTDLGDPPVFRNATQIDANRGRDMTYPPEFAPIQRACCADLEPLTLRLTPPLAYARALEVAVDMPAWQVLRADAVAMEIEAVATSALFRFKDDVMIRLRPVGADAVRVDVRSKSRDGKGDIGANTTRIREVLARLGAAR